MLKKSEKRLIAVNDLPEEQLLALSKVKMGEIHLISGFNWQGVQKARKEVELKNGDKAVVKSLILEMKDRRIAFPFSKTVREWEWEEILDKIESLEIHVNRSVKRDKVTGEPLEQPEDASGPYVALIGNTSRSFGEIVDQSEEFAGTEEEEEIVPTDKVTE